MNGTIYVLTNSKNVLDSIKESLEPISFIKVIGEVSLGKGLDFIDKSPPDIILLGEDFNLDEVAQIREELNKNRKINNIPVVYSINTPDASKVDLLFKNNLVDDYFPLNYNLSERELRITKLLEFKKLKEEIESLRIENLYYQSELANFERRRFYFDKKKNEENKESLINVMHKIRTFLTGIKEGIELLLGNELKGEDRENIINLIKRNIAEFEEFVNAEDLTLKEEKKNNEPKVTQFKSIFDEVSKRAQLEARKKSISLFVTPLKQDFSVLMNADDLEFGLETIINGIIHSTKSGSIIKGEVKPQQAGNLLEISFQISNDSINKSEFEQYIEHHPEITNFLFSQKNKMEILELEQNIIIRFQLLRLS
jgi:signal transduction histidine kinase